ncbi:sushi, von Willebrand factor type A, EGF and pentraxin domain-containing protein 1-like isoform X3 [Stegodyphus dumicola]|uniref:sushi, von Willebrand factor type A, EGF and pentraxin domain-containing protein 1-like isoform X3 n=1 Tax=Stegodyphus dumicola TaxID=202533 RepID=UPI0015AD4635|nr:sushi, von Willebrand factor type A, EGF and pentraxin domain-containing protein 1-like isoform X3 [Stegodyphus dumicola]
MTFVGESATTTCQHDGTWSHPVPKCMAPCSVPVIEHGRVTNYAPDDKVGHGNHTTVDCVAQYELRYNNTPATCNNGSWTHIPSCIPARCKTLPKRPRHGMVIAPKTDHGMKALYRCKDGYKLEGPNVTECSFGRWTGETPSCNETYCPFPGTLVNGRILLVGHMGMYDYRPYVRKITNNRQIMYECDRHYTLGEGPPGATCVDGRWSPEEKPKCVRGSHPQVRWDRSVREKREVAIRRQRRLDITKTKWKKRGKRKQKSLCKAVEETPWMEVKVLRKGRGSNALASRGAVIQVTCGGGYSLNIGNRTARCIAGRWKPRKPECVTTPCKVPYTQNGIYHHFDQEVTTKNYIEHTEVINLSCEDGFQLMGPEAIRCWYGEWAVNKMPKCLPGLCELQDIAHGSYLDGYRTGLTISHGSSIRYSCDHDFAKAVPDPVQCLEGKLRPDIPKCMAVGSRKKGYDTRIHPPPNDHNRNKSCIFRRPNPDVVAFVNDKKLNVDISKFPPGTEVVYRCSDIGKYSFEGSIRRRCMGGQWTGSEPICLGLSQEYDYALEKAPTILFRHQIGQIAQSNDGKLIVYPGTVLHLECLWIRKYGTPHWEVSHKNRKYPEGWTNEPGRDSQLEYRLSIYHAKTEDSGLFTCVTPMGHQHAVEIVVSAVHCKPIPEVGGLILSTSVTKMNVKVVFSCEPGRKLNGFEQATCLPSGQWSAKPPVCQKVPLCPYPGTSKGATISNVKFYYEISETIVFGCKDGYKIQGRNVLQCLDEGRWSGTVPTCHLVKKG